MPTFLTISAEMCRSCAEPPTLFSPLFLYLLGGLRSHHKTELTRQERQERQEKTLEKCPLPAFPWRSWRPWRLKIMILHSFCCTSPPLSTQAKIA